MEAREKIQQRFCDFFFSKDSQLLKGFEGSIGVKEAICFGTTAPFHIFIVIVRDKTLFLQLGDKCSSLQDLTQLMWRKQHCTWKRDGHLKCTVTPPRAEALQIPASDDSLE